MVFKKKITLKKELKIEYYEEIRKIKIRHKTRVTVK